MQPMAGCSSWWTERAVATSCSLSHQVTRLPLRAIPASGRWSSSAATRSRHGARTTSTRDDYPAKERSVSHGVNSTLKDRPTSPSRLRSASRVIARSPTGTSLSTEPGRYRWSASTSPASSRSRRSAATSGSPSRAGWAHSRKTLARCSRIPPGSRAGWSGSIQAHSRSRRWRSTRRMVPASTRRRTTRWHTTRPSPSGAAPTARSASSSRSSSRTRVRRRRSGRSPTR
jgi:hypothetical protein